MKTDISLKGFLQFHKGILNICIHAIGIALAVYGVWQNNWFLIVVAPLIMETGHIYNHVRRIKPYPVSVLPLQLATYIVFLFVVHVVKKFM
jgi:hypothetical protein